MNVRELIAALQKCPPDMDVQVWDAEEDDWIDVVQALYEDGVVNIHLLTTEVAVIPVHPFGSCGHADGCDACGDQPG
jgi:hypothetical protein